MYNAVKEFHEKFQIPCSDKPSLPAGEMAAFRAGFMQEELDEYNRAVAQGDMAGVLDALVDLVYVAMGTAVIHGLPFEKAFGAVHTANMAKIRAERATDSKRGTTFDVVKPAGWVAPDIQAIIDEAMAEVKYPAAGCDA